VISYTNLTYARFSTDFRCIRPGFPVEIGLNRVIKEQSILIEIVLGFFWRHFDSVREGLARRLSVFNLIIVSVLGPWGILANVLSLGQFANKLLVTIPTIRMRKAKFGLRFLNRERQFTE